jgi:hypothetical protein
MEHLYQRTSDAPEGERVSIGDYQDVAHRDFVVNLGDWLLKVPPYAEPSTANDDEYIAYVEAFGIPKKAIDTALRIKTFVPEFLDAAADEILEKSPRNVGFSTVFQQNVPSLVLAKILKMRDPTVTIVFGGDNCDGVMGSALHECFPWVDVVVRGDGELVLLEVVADVLAGRPIRPQPGLCYLFRLQLPSSMHSAQIETLRIQLFKIGARIRQTARCVRIHLASGWPFQDLFQAASLCNSS